MKEKIEMDKDDESGSFVIKSETKEVEFINYYDGSIEISICEYGECSTKILNKEETQNLIGWLVKNCTRQQDNE